LVHSAAWPQIDQWAARREVEMGERPILALRRKMLLAVVAGGSMMLLFRSRAQGSDKMTKAQAEYQETPNGIYSCATCTLFESPDGCKVLEGQVSRDGWCKAFALAD
jgi:hypothetical protein